MTKHPLKYFATYLIKCGESLLIFVIEKLQIMKITMHAKSAYLLQFRLITLAYNEPSTNQHRFTCCNRWSSSWWHWKFYFYFFLLSLKSNIYNFLLQDLTTQRQYEQIWTNGDNILIPHYNAFYFVTKYTLKNLSRILPWFLNFLLW